MKVFFVLDTLANAGAEKSTLEIISNFSSDIDLKVIYFYPKHDLKEHYEKNHIPIHFIGLNGKFNIIKGVKLLTKLIKQEKPDLLVSSIYRANIISRISCFITNTKLIGTFISDSYNEIRVGSHKKRNIYFKYYLIRVLDKLTSSIPIFWISNSKSIALSNKKALAINSGKIITIYRGRDVTKFFKWEATKSMSNFKFIFLGRILESKGLSELLDAFNVIKKNFSKIQLDIYGEGDYSKILNKKIIESNLQESVFLHGAVLDGFKKIYEADCFVFPSWYEGFSGSLVEAMISGIPIIASDIPMNLEAVTPDKTALVFKVKDTIDLRLKMEKMLYEYSSMTEMGKRAREEAMARFDIKKIANQYEVFLKSVIENKVDKSDLI